MEKRKLIVNYNKDDNNEDKKDKKTYTFVIPNSDIEDINISINKDKKKKVTESN